jgi:epoxyqueuosine reductase
MHSPSDQLLLEWTCSPSAMDGFVTELLANFRQRGYQARIVSISHLPQLQKEIDDLRINSLLDSEFYQRRLSWFNFQIPADLPGAQSLIVVAVPRPQTRAVFTWNGQRHPLIVPPTYTAYDEITAKIQRFLARMLSAEGYKSTGTALPLKLLAARSGLTQYGRNNVGYVSGMGSFLQLVAAYSDVPCGEDSWQEKEMMRSCEECDLCRRACPTGAISSDRFLLHAERCISYHNEKTGDVPFPEWMDVRWHNCVVGCMRCQRACPQNKEFIQWVGEEEEFNEEETASLLQSIALDKLTDETTGKLERLSLTDYLGCLPRNLSVFFRKTE